MHMNVIIAPLRPGYGSCMQVRLCSVQSCGRVGDQDWNNGLDRRATIAVGPVGRANASDWSLSETQLLTDPAIWFDR